MMRLLLDTHIFLWWLEDPALLSKAARSAIEEGSNIVYISSAIIWEINIKRALGKIEIPEDITAAIKSNRFSELAISVMHATMVEKLPPLHRDPFDRMLIAQALHEELTIISRDPEVHKYPVAKIMG